MAFKSLKLKFSDRLNSQLFAEGTFENQLDLISLYILENSTEKNIFKKLFAQFERLSSRQKIQYYEIFCKILSEEKIAIDKRAFIKVTRELLTIEYLREKILRFLKGLIVLKYDFLVSLYYENIPNTRLIEYVGYDSILRHLYEISNRNYNYLRFFHRNNLKFDLELNLFKSMRKEQLIAILRYAIKFCIKIENVNMKILRYEELKYLLIEYLIIFKGEVEYLIEKYFDEEVLNILHRYGRKGDYTSKVYRLKDYESLRKVLLLIPEKKFIKSIIY